MKTNRYNGFKISSNSARIVTGKAEKLEDMIQRMLDKNVISPTSSPVKTAQAKGKKKNSDGTLSSGQIEVETKLTDQSGNFEATKQDKDTTCKPVSKVKDSEQPEYNRGDDPVNEPEVVDDVKTAGYVPIKDLSVLAGIKPSDGKIASITKRIMKKANLDKENYDFIVDYFSNLYPDFYVKMMVFEK